MFKPVTFIFLTFVAVTTVTSTIESQDDVQNHRHKVVRSAFNPIASDGQNSRLFLGSILKKISQRIKVVVNSTVNIVFNFTNARKSEGKDDSEIRHKLEYINSQLKATVKNLDEQNLDGEIKKVKKLLEMALEVIENYPRADIIKNYIKISIGQIEEIRLDMIKQSSKQESGKPC